MPVCLATWQRNWVLAAAKRKDQGRPNFTSFFFLNMLTYLDGEQGAATFRRSPPGFLVYPSSAAIYRRLIFLEVPRKLVADSEGDRNGNTRLISAAFVEADIPPSSLDTACGGADFHRRLR